MHHPQRQEVDRKVERLARSAAQAGLRGVVLTTHWNFAWLTAGASNRIDISREAGAGALLVAADGRRYVLANAIEMPRLSGEALAGLDFEPVGFSWTDERADPSFMVHRATATLGGGPIGADARLDDAQPFEAELSRLRTSLDEQELVRYRALGADVGRAVGAVLHAVPAGISEQDVIREVAIGLARAGTRPLVLLAAADQRLLRHRHPLPTPTVWRDRLMVAACAERDGLVVALSRLLSARPPDRQIADRLRAAQAVFAALLDASLAGAAAAALFRTAVNAYAANGCAGEELQHHQGGAIGYRSREWIAHPHSRELLATPSAVAWNPSVTGTKVEETCLLTANGVEVITSSPGWPAAIVTVQGRTILVPDHLVLDRA